MQKLQNVERVTATTQVVNTIKRAIQTGELKVGDKLPNETELAQTIGVGRSSFREGMRILAAYGVVEIRQGEGTYIVNNISKQMFELLGFFPTRENLLYMIELRRIIEIGNIVQVYEELTEEDCAQLGACFAEMEHYRSREQFKTADRKFHDILLAKSQNPMFSEIVGMLSKMQDQLFDNYSQHEDVIIASIPYHQELLRAIRAKDVMACIHAFNNHFDATEDYIRHRYHEK